MRKAFVRLMATLMLIVGASVPATAEARTVGNTYGWSWQQPVVYVYNGTGNSPSWQISEAVAEWNKSRDSLNLQMTTNQSIADIVVTENGSIGYIGLATWSVSGNTAYFCKVELNPVVENTGLSEHDASHEIGHCLGIDHNSAYVRGSVMNTTASENTAVDGPNAFDYRTLAKIYG